MEAELSEQMKQSPLAQAADLLGERDLATHQVLSQLRDQAFEQGRLAALLQAVIGHPAL